MAGDEPGGQRYLVRHDYGMGALWWWIKAASAAEITATFAEVEVVDDPAAIRMAESWPLDELDIADAVRGPLASFHGMRQQQRRDPPFGRLLGKSRVYLRLADPDVDPGVWLSETLCVLPLRVRTRHGLDRRRACPADPVRAGRGIVTAPEARLVGVRRPG
jgi:hypothetical protein